MRINKFVAQATGLSRRAADAAIAAGRVTINGKPPTAGVSTVTEDVVQLDGQTITAPLATRTIMLSKPAGYIVSRNGQGAPTIYDLLPASVRPLKPVGRLDKDSSGLLLLTNDGDLANELTHPSRQKRKVYEVRVNVPLQPLHRQIIAEQGITLPDGISKLSLERQYENSDNDWYVSMHEGRNRQIRRTFESLGYKIRRLHRSQFGNYRLGELEEGDWKDV